MSHCGDTRYDTVASASQAVQRMLLRGRGSVALGLPTWFTGMTARGGEMAERLGHHDPRQHPCVEATSDLRSTTATPWLGPWDRVADDLEVGAGVSVDAMRAAI